MTETKFALGIAVPRRGIEITDPGRVRLTDRGTGLSFGNDLPHVAEACAPHAKLGDMKRRSRDLLLRERIHSGVFSITNHRVNNGPKIVAAALLP